MLKEPTIIDVAKKANVSVGTVSRIINGIGRVKESNRQKVLNAIKELNFRPNHYAKGLKNNKSHLIGVIVPSIKDQFYRELISQIENIASQTGYLVILLNSNGDTIQERKNIELLWDKRVDGIAIVSVGSNDDLLQTVRDTGIPVVFMDRRPVGIGFDTVLSDKHHSCLKATEYLIENGHQKIALLLGPQFIHTNTDRFYGYVKALYNHKISITNDLIWFGDFTSQLGEDFIRWYVLTDKSQRPTAVISASISITYGCLLEAKKQSIQIPDDLSLLTYGKITNEELISPKLTYCQEFSAEIGTSSIKILLERIKNPKIAPQEIVFQPDLIIQESVQKLNLKTQ